MMKKILFIGDSSLLARKEVSYKKIYTTLIKNKFAHDHIVEISGKTQNNSKEVFINLEAFMLYGYSPDIVILNYGIVDVFPRPYPRKLQKLFGCLGFLNMVDKILKKTGLYYRIGDFFNFKEVTLENFKVYNERIIQELLEREVEKIIIIGIIKPYKVLLRSRRVDNEIKLYNEVYKELSCKHKEIKYIDIYKYTDKGFTIWDGYHYSEKASKFLAEEIGKLIQND